MNSNLLTHPIVLWSILMMVMGRKNHPMFSTVPIAIFIFFITLFRPIAKWILIHGLSFGFRPPSPEQALGMATYKGYSKSLELFALSVLFLLVGYTSLYLTRKWSAWDPPPKKSPKVFLKSQWRVSHTVLDLLLLAFALMFFRYPHIAELFATLDHRSFLPDYDKTNFLTWEYLAFKGFLPYRDYWFPYGGQYNLLSPFPYALVTSYIHRFFVGFFTCACVYFISNKSRIWAFLAMLLYMTMTISGASVDTHRYFLPLVLILFFFAAKQLQYDPRLGILFGALMAWVAYFEINQFFLAVPPLVYLIFTQFFSKSEYAIKRKFKVYLVCAALTFLSFVGFLIFCLWEGHQWNGFVTFLRELPFVAIYAAEPAGMLNWFSPDSDTANVFLLCCFIFFGCAVSGWSHGLSRASEKTHFSVSMALLSAFLLLKQMVRPDISLQFMGPVCVGILVLVYYWSEQWDSRQIKLGWIGTILGVIILLRTVSWAQIKDNFAVPNYQDFQILKLESRQLREQEQKYFSPLRFLKTWPDLPNLLPELNFDFFVLGDHSELYWLKGSDIPYYISIYNSSHLAGQRRTVNWIEERKISQIVWDSREISFDFVPNVLRVPLLFEEVVSRFEMAKHIGPYLILKRRPLTSKIDFVFWLDRLGKDLDMGYVPAISLNRGHNLKIEVASPLEKSVSVDLKGPYGTLTIHFNTRPGQGVYNIALDRIWYWSVSHASGIPLEVVPKQGYKLELESNEPSDVLY